MNDEKKIEQQKMDTLLEINRLNRIIRSKRLQKVLLVVIILIAVKLIFGTINIYNIFGYPSNKARFYKVTVNDTLVTVSYSSSHQIPIVPFFINFNSSYIGSSSIDGDNDPIVSDDGSLKYIINIASYSCYSGERQVECKNDTQDMKINDDTKYSNLKISRLTKPFITSYDGKFINDITPYLKDKGRYYVEITAKHGLVTTKIYFDFDKK